MNIFWLNLDELLLNLLKNEIQGKGVPTQKNAYELKCDFI